MSSREKRWDPLVEVIGQGVVVRATEVPGALIGEGVVMAYRPGQADADDIAYQDPRIYVAFDGGGEGDFHPGELRPL